MLEFAFYGKKIKHFLNFCGVMFEKMRQNWILVLKWTNQCAATVQHWQQLFLVLLLRFLPPPPPPHISRLFIRKRKLIGLGSLGKCFSERMF